MTAAQQSAFLAAADQLAIPAEPYEGVYRCYGVDGTLAVVVRGRRDIDIITGAMAVSDLMRGDNEGLVMAGGKVARFEADSLGRDWVAY